MNYEIKKEVPEYAIEDCKSLQKCAESFGCRLPLSLAYTIYSRWSEDSWCASWEEGEFDNCTFVALIIFIRSDNWANPVYDSYEIVDDGSFPVDILEDGDKLNRWIMKIDEE